MMRWGFCVALMVLLMATACDDGGSDPENTADLGMSSSDGSTDASSMAAQDTGSDTDLMLPADAMPTVETDVGRNDSDGSMNPADAGQMVELDAAPDSSPMVELDAAPMVELDAAPMVELDAAPMVELDAAPMIELDASPIMEPDVAQACPAGQIRCDDARSARLVCNDDNQTFERVPCGPDQYCSEGACQAHVCTPDQLGCDGDSIRRCNAVGDGFTDENVEDCSARDLACIEGRCADPIAASRGAVCNTIECLASRTTNVICGRYATDILDMERRPFMRGANRCDPGTLTEAAYAEALRATNYGRWLAGLAEVVFEAELNPPAQACATIMANQGNLSHNPSPDWECYTEEGARSALVSNIQLTFGGELIADSIVRFFWDEGAINSRTVGHRRWMQSPTIGTMGFGYHEGLFTGDSAACLNVIGGEDAEATGPPFIAYPTPGPFPKELLKKGRTALPWSVAHDAPFVEDWPETDQWRVSVSRMIDGAVEALEITNLHADQGWHGRTRAVVFTPDFDVTEGHYRIEVEAGEWSYVWETEIVRCDR